MRRIDVQSPKRVFELSLELARGYYSSQEKSPPRRGHPWVYEHPLYLAILLFRAYFLLTYRATIAFYQDLYPDSPCPSFQSLHRYFSRNLKPEDLEGLGVRLRERLEPFLPKDDPPLFILDTTGVTHRGLTQELRWRRGLERREVRGHSRLALLISYYPKSQLLLIEGVKAGGGYASDIVLGKEALRQGKLSGPLLADAGFDSLDI